MCSKASLVLAMALSKVTRQCHSWWVFSAFIPVSSFFIFLIECCDKNVCLLMYILSNFYDVH